LFAEDLDAIALARQKVRCMNESSSLRVIGRILSAFSNALHPDDWVSDYELRLAAHFDGGFRCTPNPR
jgi:hypothetical protein